MNLGPGKEFDRIRAIIARLGEFTDDVADLGDDCALIPLGRSTLAVSIDSSIEDVHFRTDWLDFKEIGFRAAGSALSDLAAEGGTPIGVLVSLGLPSTGETNGVDPAVEIMAGVATMVNNLEAKVLGGDLARSDKYIVDVCVLGMAERPVRRSGAREGDALWVTGYLGGAALALERLRAGAGARMSTPLRNRYACPEPRIAAGRWLAHHGATAMIDISDGLASDVQHLSAASGVGIEINLERIPCWEGVEAMAAVASGEEFELLVTMPPMFGDASASAFRGETGVELTRIGTCLRTTGGRRSGARLLDHNTPVPLPPGYDHFATPQ
ncbi:MAG TPA: thiamine-phosphate kinase [Gemmatimonadales bacterium]|nr:thiamine-phosphate kinase [Gemmatimonadales bacterium]